MSIKLMTAVWDAEGLSSTQKLVLLALADWANDEGLCWPSVERLAKKTGLSGRAIQKTIRGFEELGIVRREEELGKGNRYWLDLCPTFTPEPRSPLPLNHVHPTPEPRSPNTSEIPHRTPHPSIAGAKSATVERPEGVPAEAWADWLKARKAKRLPLTPTALKGIEREAAKAGWTLAEAVTECARMGWAGFKAEWVATGRGGHHRPSGQKGDGFTSALDLELGIGGRN